MPTVQEILSAQMIGPMALSGLSAGSATLALNASNTWLAGSYIPPTDRTLAKVKLYCTLVTGTVAAADCVCILEGHSALVPDDVSIQTISAADAVPSANTWQQWSGFTTALTAGRQYWFVFKNVNATDPTLNYPTYRSANGCGISGSVQDITGGTSTIGVFTKKHTTTGAGGWGTTSAPIPMILEFSDGSFDGNCVHNIAVLGSGDRVYGTTEVGTQFTYPASFPTLKVRGVVMYPASPAHQQENCSIKSIRERVHHSSPRRPRSIPSRILPAQSGGTLFIFRPCNQSRLGRSSLSSWITPSIPTHQAITTRPTN